MTDCGEHERCVAQTSVTRSSYEVQLVVNIRFVLFTKVTSQSLLVLSEVNHCCISVSVNNKYRT